MNRFGVQAVQARTVTILDEIYLGFQLINYDVFTVPHEAVLDYFFLVSLRNATTNLLLQGLQVFLLVPWVNIFCEEVFGNKARMAGKCLLSRKAFVNDPRPLGGARKRGIGFNGSGEAHD
jgi:hypothetical protein